MTDLPDSYRGDGWLGLGRWTVVIRSAATVAVFVVLARALAAGRDVVIAGEFGTASELDAYLQAMLLPTLAVTTAAGALPSAFIPAFTRAKAQRGEAEATELASSLMCICLVTLGVLALATAAMAPLAVKVLGLGFNGAKTSLTLHLLLLLTPLMLLSGLSAFWAAFLNAKSKFAIAAVAPGITPLAVAVSAWLGHGRLGAYALALGTLLGATLEAAVIGTAAYRAGAPAVPRWHGWREDTRLAAREYAGASAGALVMSSTLVVDGAMAASLGAGSVAVFNYGGKVFSFAAGASALVLGTVALPRVSQMVAAERFDGAARRLVRYTALAFGAGAVLAAALIATSDMSVGILFRHGSFTQADARHVVPVQNAFLLQIPFYVAATLPLRMLFALNRNWTVLKIGMALTVSNAIGDLVLMRILGVTGIALSTTVNYAMSSVAVCVIAARALERRAALQPNPQERRQSSSDSNDHSREL